MQRKVQLHELKPTPKHFLSEHVERIDQLHDTSMIVHEETYDIQYIYIYIYIGE